MSNWCTEMLTVHPVTPSILEKINREIEAGYYPDMQHALEAGVLGSRDFARFYSADEINHGINYAELNNISRLFPDVLFIVDGRNDIGEDYRIYWNNGKFQSVDPIITWPKFDPDKAEEYKEVRH